MDHNVALRETRPVDGKATGSVADEVQRTVDKQEALERRVPRIIYGVIIGLPLLTDFAKHGEVTFTKLLTAVVCFFVAKAVVWLVRSAILNPLHVRRYDRAAARLKQQLSRSAKLSMGPFSWTLFAPGAFAVDDQNNIIALVRSRGYESLTIPASSIAGVRVRSETELVTDTVQSGRALIGAGSHGSAVGYASGGRSRSVTRQVSQHFLEIRYQLVRNGPVEALIIPGGPDDQVVENLCAAIRRLEA